MYILYIFFFWKNKYDVSARQNPLFRCESPQWEVAIGQGPNWNPFNWLKLSSCSPKSEFPSFGWWKKVSSWWFQLGPHPFFQSFNALLERQTRQSLNTKIWWILWKTNATVPHKGRPGLCLETHWVFNKLFSAKLRKSYFIWEVHKTTTESLFAAMKPSRNTFRWPCGWMEEFWKDSTYWATFPRGVTLTWQSLTYNNILRLPSTIVAFQRNLP